MPNAKESRSKAYDAAQEPLSEVQVGTSSLYTDTSFGCGRIAAALAKAQSEMHNAAFNRVNPHFKSQYADLAAIRDATLPSLTKNGLAVTQFTSLSGTGEILLHTLLLHESGQSVEGIYPIARGTPQQMGSQLTYARRYSWSAICGIAADDDDDATAAEKVGAPTPRVIGLNVRSDQDGVVLVAAEQRDELIDLCEKYKVDKAGFCKYFDVPSIADVPEHRYEEAKAKIEQSGRKRGLA